MRSFFLGHHHHHPRAASSLASYATLTFGFPALPPIIAVIVATIIVQSTLPTPTTPVNHVTIW